MNDRELFESNLELIDRVIATVCRRARLFGADAEDFASSARIALIENDYAILRKYSGRPSFAAYLASWCSISFPISARTSLGAGIRRARRSALARPGFFSRRCFIAIDVADGVTFNGPPLPPADPPSAGVYSLDGVGLKILNAANTTLSEPRGLDCLPSLHTYLGGTIGAPAPWVYLPDRTNVQAWLDVPGGEWLAYLMSTNPPCPTVPSISVLTMETAGDPQLEYWPWDGSPSTTVTLQGGSPNINVMNFANGRAFVEDNADFRLNYCLTVPFPPLQGISIPQANACRFRSPATYNVDGCGDAGPGCSNTTYP